MKLIKIPLSLPHAAAAAGNSPCYGIDSKFLYQCHINVHRGKYMQQMRQDSLLVDCQTHDWKVASSRPGRTGGRTFVSRVNCLCWLLFGVCSTLCYCNGTLKTPVILPKLQVADYTKTRIHPWPNKVGVGWHCCPCIVWEPTRETTSPATHQGTLCHNHLSLLSHYGLILA